MYLLSPNGSQAARLSTALIFFGAPFITAAALVPRFGPSQIHERRTAHPDWADAQRLPFPASVPVPLRIALAQQNLASLSDHLLAVSDPASHAYGAHWSPEDVVKAFAPAEEASIRVTEWLVHSGVAEERVRVSYNKAWIDVEGVTAEEVERLLDTEYRVFRRGDGEEHVGTLFNLFV